MLTIPQVDLGRVNSADGQSALVNACSDVGMFRAVGHGISTDTLNEAMAAHEVLFSIDAVELAEIPIQPGGLLVALCHLAQKVDQQQDLSAKMPFRTAGSGTQTRHRQIHCRAPTNGHAHSALLLKHVLRWAPGSMSR